MINLQSDKPNEHADDSDESLQTFSKTCSIMYGKISKKRSDILQAMTVIQDDMFDSCNGLVKEQVDMLEEYTDRGIVSKEYMLPVIGMANDSSNHIWIMYLLSMTYYYPECSIITKCLRWQTMSLQG